MARKKTAHERLMADAKAEEIPCIFCQEPIEPVEGLRYHREERPTDDSVFHYSCDNCGAEYTSDRWPIPKVAVTHNPRMMVVFGE